MIRALSARVVALRSKLAAATLALTFTAAALTSLAAPARADVSPVIATEMMPYASLLRTINPHLAVAQSAAYARTLLEAARRFHIDPNLIVALVTVESSWRPGVTSIHGARGLGQLLPGTAHDLRVDAWSGRDNLRGTTDYLHRLLGTFHGARDPVREALAGYNAGPAAVEAAGGAAPTYESRHYVVKVMRALAMVRTRVARLAPGADGDLLDDAVAGASPSAADLDAAIAAVEAAQTTYWGAGDASAVSETPAGP